MKIKPGDFIQTNSHFGDVFFEVVKAIYGDPLPSSRGEDFCFITWVSYGKYSGVPKADGGWTTMASRIRCVIPAEMAIPVMMFKRLRFYAAHGQYDPIYGFAPIGTPLRRRDDPF